MFGSTFGCEQSTNNNFNSFMHHHQHENQWRGSNVGSAMCHQVDQTRNPNQVVPNKFQSIRKLANATTRTIKCGSALAPFPFERNPNLPVPNQLLVWIRASPTRFNNATRTRNQMCIANIIKSSTNGAAEGRRLQHRSALKYPDIKFVDVAMSLGWVYICSIFLPTRFKRIGQAMSTSLIVWIESWRSCSQSTGKYYHQETKFEKLHAWLDSLSLP